MIVILPTNFQIRDHAAERFLERIIGRDFYTTEDIKVAIEIIRNILLNRALKKRLLGQNQIQLKYRNAVFVYDKDTNYIITAYLDDKSKYKVEWIYKFPAAMHFEGQISSDKKLRLITQGFIPIRKDGRFIVGQVEDDLFSYDPKYNVISPL